MASCAIWIFVQVVRVRRFFIGRRLIGLLSPLALDPGPVSPLPLSRPSRSPFPKVAWHTQVVRGPTSVQGGGVPEGVLVGDGFHSSIALSGLFRRHYPHLWCCRLVCWVLRALGPLTRSVPWTWVVVDVHPQPPPKISLVHRILVRRVVNQKCVCVCVCVRARVCVRVCIVLCFFVFV